MSTRKNGKLTRLIALAINLQLVITTSAFAGDNNTLQGISNVVNTIGQVGGAAMQGMQQMQMQQMQAQQQAMMQQQYGLTPVDPSQIPKVLADNGCLVLPARPEYPVDKCENYDAQQAQSGYYTALLSVAQNNENDVENFLTSGHQRFTTQGVGCYEKALKQFTAALNTRIEALNKLDVAIEQEVANFKKLAEKDVMNLKKGNALLEGRPAELLKDIKFQDKFADPQCKSFMESAKINSTGKKGGFRGIQAGLATVLDSAKPNKFKGQEVSIKRDIRKIAKRVGKLAQKKKVFSIDPGKLGIRSKYLNANNSTLKAIITESSTNATSEVQNLKKEMLKSISSSDKKAQSILAGIESNTVDLDNALYIYERDKKNTCLNSYLSSNFGGVTEIASRLKDPNISAKANKESDNALRNTIVSILSDDQYTVEQKVAKIKEAESKKGNDRWSFTTGKTVNIKGKQIGASTRLRASDMVSIFTDNCTQRFESQNNEKGKSDRAVVSQLKNYKTKYNSLQKKFATTIQEKIISEMVNCPSQTTEGTGALSCSAKSLNMDSGNFCLRTANVCAGNMIACKDKADKIVETTRMEQKVIAKRYKKNMDQFKAKLAQTFMATNKIMEGSARQLDGMYQFGSTYSIPMNLDLSLVTDQLLAQEGIDSSLLIEDPEKYQAAVKKNIAALKKSVKQQNDEILNGKASNKDMTTLGGAGQASKYKGLIGEVKKYQDNYAIQKSEWGKIKQKCSAMIDQHNNMIADQNKAADEADSEYNKKVGDICKKVQGFNNHPAGFCGEASELGDEIFDIAAVAGDSSAAASLKEFDNTCDSFNNEAGDNQVDNSFFSKENKRDIASNTTPEKFCQKFGNEVRKPCSKYTATVNARYRNGACEGSLEDYAQDYDISEHNFWVQKADKNDHKTMTDETYESLNQCQAAIQNGKEKTIFCFKMKKDDLKNNSELLASFAKENEKKIWNNQKDCFNPEDNSITYKNFKKAEDTINEYIAQGKRAKQISSLGHVNVSFCNANYGGDIGKEFMNQLGQQQQSRGFAGGYSQ